MVRPMGELLRRTLAAVRAPGVLGPDGGRLFERHARRCASDCLFGAGSDDARNEHGRHDGSQGGSTGMDLFSVNRSEEHTSELQSLMRITYAVFCLNKKKKHNTQEQ